MVAEMFTESAVASIRVPISPGRVPWGGRKATVTFVLPRRLPTVAVAPVVGVSPGARPRNTSSRVLRCHIRIKPATAPMPNTAMAIPEVGDKEYAPVRGFGFFVMFWVTPGKVPAGKPAATWTGFPAGILPTV